MKILLTTRFFILSFLYYHFILSFLDNVYYAQCLTFYYFSAVILPMFFTKLVLQHPYNGSLCIAVPPPLQPLFNGSKPPTYETAGIHRYFLALPLPPPSPTDISILHPTGDFGHRPQKTGGGGDGEWIFKKNLNLYFLHSFPFSFKVTVSRKKNYI